MKKEYDLNELKARPNKVIPDSGRISISIRIDANDLADVKRMADSDGIPYQTLINSILHKYVTNQLVEKRSDRRYAAGG